MSDILSGSSQTVLAHYDRAHTALTQALGSARIEAVLHGRVELDLIKRRARQIRNRALLADASEFQMRVERHLGELLNAATEAGQLRKPGQRGRVMEDEAQPATLAEIGVDAKLSMKARQAAAMDPEAFTVAISDMRSQLASGHAKLVDPINLAAKAARAKKQERSAA